MHPRVTALACVHLCTWRGGEGDIGVRGQGWESPDTARQPCASDSCDGVFPPTRPVGVELDSFFLP